MLTVHNVNSIALICCENSALKRDVKWCGPQTIDGTNEFITQGVQGEKGSYSQESRKERGRLCLQDDTSSKDCMCYECNLHGRVVRVKPEE
ncbi:hypothetical protein OIU76_000034 [Salix suchowensis]|nr:hypothetical protein OIU76_000034 [Salix suchowensis]KAJ6383286.1 hypothetical protein OIU78_026716 [Salix suchowensis]